MMVGVRMNRAIEVTDLNTIELLAGAHRLRYAQFVTLSWYNFVLNPLDPI